MAEKIAEDLEKKTFKILGFGTKGDARIRLESGRSCFVSGIPKGYKTGSAIHITGLREGAGSSSFATYHGLPNAGNKTLTDTEVTRQADSMKVYQLFLGPIAKADRCAMISVPADYLKKNAFSALLEIISRYDDTGLIPDSNSRAIVKGMDAVVKRARADKAVNELEITLGYQPIKQDTPKNLEDFFGSPNEGKYRAFAVIAEKRQTLQPEYETKISTSTLTRKGSPG